MEPIDVNMLFRRPGVSRSIIAIKPFDGTGSADGKDGNIESISCSREEGLHLLLTNSPSHEWEVS